MFKKIVVSFTMLFLVLAFCAVASPVEAAGGSASNSHMTVHVNVHSSHASGSMSCKPSVYGQIYVEAFWAIGGYDIYGSSDNSALGGTYASVYPDSGGVIYTGRSIGSVPGNSLATNWYSN